MQPLQKQIALEFSGGNFEFAYPYLAEDATWDIVGDKLLAGKSVIVDFCEKTAEYFTNIVTEFKTDNVIADEYSIVINGTAQFHVKIENRSHYISSCDVYKFKDGKLQEIISYCISTKKETK